jgi:uncharacterized protein (TIGR02611 family)
MDSSSTTPPTAPSKDISDTSDTSDTSDSSDSSGTSVDQPPSRLSRWRTRIQATYELIRANPTGRITLKIVVAITGLAVVALGLALVPLPGPGWLIVLVGLSIWAIEYAWARHLLLFTRRQLQRWTHWIARQSWPIRIVIGLVGLVFVSIVVWASLKFSFGIDLVAKFLDYLATH